MTGATGGVGSAVVQLAKRRGACVAAVASSSRADKVRALGADEVVDRNEDLNRAVGRNCIDVVAGPVWPTLMDVFKVGGWYATAGAIAGALVELDIRTLHLKDLTLVGCTFQDDVVFEKLVSYIERAEIRPLVARTFPLHEIVRAQEAFLAKQFTGKLVLLPPA